MGALELVRGLKFKFERMGVAKEKIIEKLLFIAALSSILIVFFIIAFMLKESIPALALGWDFFFGMSWYPSHSQFGIFPIVVSTFVVGLGALAIAAAIGIPTAIFLAEFSPRWLRNIIKPSVEMLVGIPSVVLGFFGLMVFVVFIRDSFGGYGECILAGWIILAIMTLPHVISISEDALRAVPEGYKEASLALGASKWQTVRSVVLKSAYPGIITGILLGAGKAIGEAAVILLTTGGLVTYLPRSLLDDVGALPVYIYMVLTVVPASRAVAESYAFGASLVLITMFLMISVFALFLRNRYVKRMSGSRR